MEVMFGTPSYDRMVCIEYANSMVSTSRDLTSRGVALSSFFAGGNCFVDQARNAIVKFFLKQTTADSLFFIDADIGWDSAAVMRLLEHPAEVVAGLPPKRSDEVVYHQNALTGVMREGMLQSLEAPTAFMRIKRSVFERLDSAYPEYKKLDVYNKATPYFQTGFYEGGFIGEDIFFCRQWVKLGECVWIDPKIDFTHRGGKAWSGNFHKHARETGLYTFD